MNDLCKCGKPPHAGGCKLGPETEEERAKLAAAPKFTPMCNRGPDPKYVPVDVSSPKDLLKTTEVWVDTYLDISGLHTAMADLLRECVKVQATKGHDYTKGSEDRLYNFRSAGEEAGITMVQAWYVLFQKHLLAVQTYVKHGQVESEPIRGRIVDCINYLLLLWLIVREKDPEQT